MIKQSRELSEFWTQLKSQAAITFKDMDSLSLLLGKALLKIDELEKSRDSWREKFEELKLKKRLNVSDKLSLNIHDEKP